MKKTIILILVLWSVVVLMIRFGGKITEVFLGIKENSGLSVLSSPEGVEVFLNGSQVGKTPYEDKSLDSKEYTLRLQKDQLKFWEGRVKLVSGTLTVVNRELSKDAASQAGEILTLNKGRGLTVISNPRESEVEVDGKAYGQTPLIINSILSGEHTIEISHLNYLKRSIRASLPDGYNLTVSLDLAISEADLSTISTPPITATPQLVVKDTPTGFLRVRDKPSLSGSQIAQVKPGETLVLLEELPSWYRVRLADGTEGYVSSTYVEKKTQ